MTSREKEGLTEKKKIVGAQMCQFADGFFRFVNNVMFPISPDCSGYPASAQKIHPGKNLCGVIAESR